MKDSAENPVCKCGHAKHRHDMIHGYCHAMGSLTLDGKECDCSRYRLATKKRSRNAKGKR